MAKYEKMNRSDLEKAKVKAQAELDEISKAQADYDGRRLKELRAEIEGMLSKEGYSLSDLGVGSTGRKGGGKSGTKRPPKYRHPENSSVTWSGRGRQPQWIKDHEAQGGSREDFAI